MKRYIIFLLIGVLLLTGCSAKQSDIAYPEAMPEFEALTADGVYQESSKNGMVSEYDTATGNGVEASSVERLVIKNASLGIAVVDPVATLEEIGRLAEEMGGFLVTSRMSKYVKNGAEIPQGSITIRVPSEKLDDAMALIKGMAVDQETGVMNESITGQDVTAEYTDSKSRLKNLQSAEAQLVELLDSATDLQYTLEIFRELTSIRGQIEVLQGQIKYYEEAAALSSISVEVIGEASLQPIEIAGWKPKGIAKDAIQALVNTLQSIGTGLIWFGLYCLPFLLPLGVGVFFLVKGIRKGAAKRKAMKEAAAIIKSEDKA